MDGEGKGRGVFGGIKRRDTKSTEERQRKDRGERGRRNDGMRNVGSVKKEELRR